MTDNNIEVIRAEIAKLEMRPGDRLIIKINDPYLIDEHRDMIFDQFGKAFPDHKIILINGDIDISVVGKGE
uniref:Uncharacterized protein n=1 Tax=viral metagenome TaxID=1070528 RepID=A0A6M3IRI3_9ZZZZ